jgi:LuxR family quorum-sensing system transcriptional regulator CciR
MAQCGIAYVACASHVDPLNPPKGAVALVNYPADWLEHFSAKRYARYDPVFHAARAAATPFRWSDILYGRDLRANQKRILSEARECGIVDGITIPIHTPYALPASCSLVPGPDGFDPLLMPDLQFMAIHAHDEARRRLGDKLASPVRLTERQRECLVLAANAKSDWVIGQILGVSPRTVHNTLEMVKRRYGVSHRIQAVMRALLDGEISAHDIGVFLESDDSSSAPRVVK